MIGGILFLLGLGLFGCVEPTAGDGDSSAPKTLTSATFVFTGGGTNQDGETVQDFKMEITFRGRKELSSVRAGDGLNSYLTNLSFLVNGAETYFDYTRQTDVFDLGIGGEATETTDDQLAFKANASQQTFKCWFDEDESQFEINLAWPYTLTAHLKVQTLPGCTFSSGEYTLQANLIETSDVWEEYSADSGVQISQNENGSHEPQGGTETSNPKKMSAITFVFAGEGKNQTENSIENLRMEVTFRGRTELESIVEGDSLNSYLTNISSTAKGIETYFDYERSSSEWDLGIIGEAIKVDKHQITIEADATQQGFRCWFNNARFEIDLENYTLSGILDVRTLPGCSFPSGVYEWNAAELIQTIDVWDESVKN